MMRILVIVTAAICVLPVFWQSSFALQRVEFGRYHALVIGNNAYRHLPKLGTAVNDATATADLLRKKYGFTVTLLRDATREDILRAINRLRAELTENDNLLIYYAGHGALEHDTGMGYWLPVDAEPENDLNWIANDALTRRLKGMSARHVIVVADSCFSGTLVRTARARPATGVERQTWIRRVAERRSRTALVSGGLEPVTDAGANGHSTFANAFLRALRENTDILDGDELFLKVSRQVVVNADQTPQYSEIRQASHEGGEFLFIPSKQLDEAARTTAAADTPDNDMAVEMAFWDSINDSRSARDYMAYLDTYPSGRFAPLAMARLDQLRVSDEAEEAAWRIASEIGTLAAFRSYLDNHAQGRHALTARALIDEVERTLARANVAETGDEDLWQFAEKGEATAGYRAYLEAYPDGRHASIARGRIANPPEKPAQERSDAAVSPYDGTWQAYGVCQVTDMLSPTTKVFFDLALDVAGTKATARIKRSGEWTPTPERTFETPVGKDGAIKLQFRERGQAFALNTDLAAEEETVEGRLNDCHLKFARRQ